MEEDIATTAEKLARRAPWNKAHSLRCTKAVLIYRRTSNLRAVQLLLGHSKIESTVRYLGIELDDAIEIAGKIDI
jgi:site-specific recombinase XerD